MKKMLTMLVCGILFYNGNAQTNQCNIQVTGLKSNTGKCLVYLFKDKNGFPTTVENAFKATSAPVSNGKCTAVFKEIPNGDFAVAVIHDENTNGKLDTNFLGIPKEGIGTSNNVKSTFGPPDFEDSRFQINGQGKSLSITINYL